MGIFDGFKGGQGGIAAQQEQDRLAREELARQMVGAQPGQVISGHPNQLQQAYNQYQQAQMQAAMQQAKQAEEFDPNKSEAWTMPMSALVNLWRAKYLDEWVILRSDEVENFWYQAVRRLKLGHKFEEAPGQWVRLKEDA